MSTGRGSLPVSTGGNEPHISTALIRSFLISIDVSFLHNSFVVSPLNIHAKYLRYI